MAKLKIRYVEEKLKEKKPSCRKITLVRNTISVPLVVIGNLEKTEKNMFLKEILNKQIGEVVVIKGHGFWQMPRGNAENKIDIEEAKQ